MTDEKENALYDAAAAFLRESEWEPTVIGGTVIRQQSGDSFRFELVIMFTSGMPPKKRKSR